jgi:hypothetical protein
VVASALSFTMPVSGLPFGITLVSVTATDDALLVAASAKGIVVSVR